MIILPNAGAAQLASRIENATSEGQCRAIAAEAPTAEGVRVLLRRCQEIAEQRAARQREDARRLAELRANPIELREWKARCAEHDRHSGQRIESAKDMRVRANLIDADLRDRPHECWLLDQPDR
jgi:hypothetical protein